MSTTECYAMVRGSALRVTSLTRAGEVGPDAQFAVSKSVSKVSITEITDSGSTELIRSEETDEPRLLLVRSEQTIRFGIEATFLKVDPGLLNLMSAVPVVRNAAGDAVGFDAKTRLPISSFALEIWSALAGDKCPRPAPVLEGFGMGPFGVIPFGGSVDSGFGIGPFGESAFGAEDPVRSGGPYRRWGYTLFPWLKGGYITGLSFSSGAVSFTVRGARTQKGAKWGYGPYDINGEGSPVIEPVGPRTNWRNAIVGGAPPPASCGAVSLIEASA